MAARNLPASGRLQTNPIVRRLSTLASLTDTEQAALTQLGARRERHRPGDELQAEGEFARRPRFVLSGWAFSQRLLADGRRQVFRFALPGDAIGVYPTSPPPALQTIVAATVAETVDAEPILALVRNQRAPGLLRALATAARIDEARQLDQVVRLGRQTAYERVAHFLLELHDRLTSVGVGEGLRFPLPLTQELLADTLGLSIVHVNRTLQQLRRDGLIELRSGVAALLDREQLATIADYRTPTPPTRPRRPGG